MMILYAATSNPGKLAEFATSASTSGGAHGEEIEVLALPGLQQTPEPVEDATTFQGNADLKAIAYSLAAPGLLVFADDSGLEVIALGGQPGLRSARFADDHSFALNSTLSTDQRNNALLLDLMEHQPSRAARFVCNLALARDGHVLLRAEGSVEGQLLELPRGEDGFGYDPLFLVPSLNLTFAEIPREQKWELSHRGNAFRALLAQLPALQR
jgi:XTP/dITP diphosphohydrolase